MQFRQGDAILTVDTAAGPDGRGGCRHTRIRTPFLNQDCYSFLVRRACLWSELGRRLGLTDYRMGVPELDRPFVFEGNELARTRTIFLDPAVRSALVGLMGLRSQQLWVDKGWRPSGRGAGIDALCFAVRGLVVNLPTLRHMVALVQGVLAQVQRTGWQPQDPVERAIRALLAPGGQIREGELLLWDGDPPRRRAAESLVRWKDPRAVPALVQTLTDPDAEVHAQVARALGEIGDRAVLAHLIPLLGRDPSPEGSPGKPPGGDTVSKLDVGEVSDRIRSLLLQSVSAGALLPAEQRGAILAAFAAAGPRREPEEARSAGA